MAGQSSTKCLKPQYRKVIQAMGKSAVTKGIYRHSLQSLSGDHLHINQSAAGGFSPVEIMFFRLVVAYAALVIISPVLFHSKVGEKS